METATQADSSNTGPLFEPCANRPTSALRHLSSWGCLHRVQLRANRRLRLKPALSPAVRSQDRNSNFPQQGGLPGPTCGDLNPIQELHHRSLTQLSWAEAPSVAILRLGKQVRANSRLRLVETPTHSASSSIGPLVKSQRRKLLQRRLATSAPRFRRTGGSGWWRPRPYPTAPASVPWSSLSEGSSSSNDSPPRHPGSSQQSASAGGRPDPIASSSTGPLLESL